MDSKKYIGMDVHKESISIAVMNGAGKIVMECVIETTSQHVAVINEAFAKKYFNKENPIGQYFGRPELESPRLYKIVGVTQDARYLNFDFDKPIGPFFFLAEAQHDVVPKTGGDSNPGSHHLHDIILVTRLAPLYPLRQYAKR